MYVLSLLVTETQVLLNVHQMVLFFTQSSFMSTSSVKSSSGGVVFFFYSKDIHVKTLYIKTLYIIICNVWFRGSNFHQ